MPPLEPGIGSKTCPITGCGGFSDGRTERRVQEGGGILHAHGQSGAPCRYQEPMAGTCSVLATDDPSREPHRLGKPRSPGRGGAPRAGRIEVVRLTDLKTPAALPAKHRRTWCCRQAHREIGVTRGGRKRSESTPTPYLFIFRVLVFNWGIWAAERLCANIPQYRLNSITLRAFFDCQATGAPSPSATSP